METKYLRYFLQICEDKSLSQAAKKLFLSQQALSTIVRKLEDELQIPLFKRSKSGMQLTEYGECLEKQACKLINTLEETSEKLDAIKNGHHDVLNIAVSFGVMSALPPHYISIFQQRYPHIELHFTEYQDTFCEQAVLDERVNLGFNIAPIDPVQFDIHTVIRDQMCILVNEKNSLSKKTVVHFDELKGQSFVLLNKNFKLRKTFTEKCRQAGFEPQVVLETMELILVHNFSRLNKGVGVGVDFIAHDLANVVPVPFKPECPWEVCVITKKGKRLPKAAQCFLQYIKQFDCFYPARA
jgi:DNA-binding transcriptional LysR family regulator